VKVLSLILELLPAAP